MLLASLTGPLRGRAAGRSPSGASVPRSFGGRFDSLLGSFDAVESGFVSQIQGFAADGRRGHKAIGKLALPELVKLSGSREDVDAAVFAAEVEFPIGVHRRHGVVP